MNEFLNPFNTIPLLKSTFIEPGRINRVSPEKIHKHIDNSFRKMIEYAYSVPLYHQKYKNAGIHPNDIKGIKDIKKLPFVTKNDIIENFPDGIIPKNYNKNKSYVVNTSGSTGEPVAFYTDFSTMMKSITLFIRGLQQLNLDWRSSRIAHIGNFSRNKADYVFQDGLISKSSSFYNHNNYLMLNNFDPLPDIIAELDKFNPDMIVSYPVTFKNLAYFKNKGYGKNINPKVLTVGGYVLDDQTKTYVEDSFNCKLLNVYASAESGGDISFECMHNTWHINYDFFHLEAIDDNERIVDEGKVGQVVLTRLFGKGTPMIRYTGMNDFIKITRNYDCSCGLCTPIIEGGIQGRASITIYLPDGRMYPSASFECLSTFLTNEETKKIKQFQIIQKSLYQLDIHVVFFEDSDASGPSRQSIMEKIRDKYQEKVGSQVNIKMKELNEIKSINGKPTPVVVSKLTDREREKILEIVEQEETFKEN